MPDFERTILALGRGPEGPALDAAFAGAMALPADTEVFAALVSTARSDLVALYMAAKRSSPDWAKITRPPRNLRLDNLVLDAASRGHLAMLKTLHKGGFSLEPIREGLFVAAGRDGQMEIISWLEDVIWQGRLPDTMLGELILECGKTVSSRIAPLLADIMLRHAKGGLIDFYMLEWGFRCVSPKLFAALLLAGPGPKVLAELLATPPRNETCPGLPARRACAERALSNHGRMELCAREPSLAAVIARPAEMSFLGLGQLDQ